MSNDFLLNSIVGIQHQIRALDCSLEMLINQLQPKQDTADPRNPVCPKCGHAVIDVSLNGQKPREYQCAAVDCTFRGSLE